MGTRTALAAFLAALAPATAQEDVRQATRARPPETQPRPAATTRPGPKLDPRGITFDRVLATYGDFVVTESMIRDQLHFLLRARPGGPSAVSTAEREQLQKRILRDAVSDEIQAQAAKTLTPDPGDIERELEKAWDREVKEKTTAAGSSTGLMSRLEEMGMTWDQYQTEWRTRELRNIYLQQELFRKFGGEQTQVTPSEIREYYRLHSDEFARKESADLEGVKVPGDHKDAQSMAARALEALRQGKTAAQAAAASGGTALPEDVYAGIGPKSPHAQALKEFASTHKTDESGGPVQIGRDLLVLRVTRRQEGREASFSDPAVQEAIVKTIASRRMQNYGFKLLNEQRRRAFIWPEDLFR